MIAIARVLKTVGIRGEVRLEPLTHDLRRFATLRAVMTGIGEQDLTPRTIEALRIVNGYVQVQFEGVQKPEQANALRGQYVYVEDNHAVRPRDGEFFIHEIIGLSVVATDGTFVGTIRDVLEMPVNDLWVVARGTKEFLVPAVREIVREVDIKNGRVVIHPPEGLIDDAD
jgi:16S rRNA processing protein RimM